MTPTRFKQELKQFDSKLDFVFNGRKSRWEIIGIDRKNIKYLIKSFALGELETLGVETLRVMADCSPIKSSAAEVNRRLDRIKAEEEATQEKAEKNAVNDRLDEAWEHYQYAEGSRISFARTGQKKDETSFVINDKRRFADSSANKTEE